MVPPTVNALRMSLTEHQMAFMNISEQLPDDEFESCIVSRPRSN